MEKNSFQLNISISALYVINPVEFRGIENSFPSLYIHFENEIFSNEKNEHICDLFQNCKNVQILGYKKNK